MKFVLLILGAMLVSWACVQPNPHVTSDKTGLNRYENNEVVCFSTDGEHSLWCYKK